MKRNLLLTLAAGLWLVSCAQTTINPLLTSTPEPIIPTPTPQIVGAAAAVEVAEAAPILPERPTPTVTAAEADANHFQRFGISGWGTGPSDAYAKGMVFSQFLNWTHIADPLLPNNVTHWKMVRASLDPAKAVDWESVEQVARSEPGSIWIIGNEMDVRWQDNVSAEVYADLYHDAYIRLKTADANAQIAFGGVAQATPLRLQYLDDVLSAYATKYGVQLPTDIFTVHAYVLREERDSWGVDIPPGMDSVNTGKLYEIENHDDLDLFINQIAAFRQWMAANGYRDKPLAVTEFGILLPNDYGFPPEAVMQYMRDTIDLMVKTTDPVTGYPPDDNRLVQTWFWYVVEDSPSRYPTSNLYNSETAELTPLGETWRDLVLQLGQP